MEASADTLVAAEAGADTMVVGTEASAVTLVATLEAIMAGTMAATIEDPGVIMEVITGAIIRSGILHSIGDFRYGDGRMWVGLTRTMVDGRMR